ncbi:MFS transporter [Ramlibacter sp.]|uniref:MFS transporter n=1 Tax=Ramlibacter sp. TaxID=1917967 RepID=UPI00183E2CC5|nr:MFS transporter [Ramlibacter sp.]MBA2676328.1 MFS transporter [Ramlibacter sp.]
MRLPFALGLTAFLPFYAVLVLTASLPTIQRELDTGGRPVGWLVSASLAGIGVGYLLAGTVSDRFGRRRILLGGLAVFAIASLLQAAVADFETFLRLRILQAAAGGASLILIGPIFRDLYPDDFVALARGNLLVGICTALGPTLGAPTGALFESSLGWRAGAVWIAVLACAALYLCWRFVPETLRARSSLAGSVRGLGANLLLPRLWLASLVGAAGLGAAYIFINAAPFLVMRDWGRSAAFYGTVSAIPSVATVLVALTVRRFAGKLHLPALTSVAAAVQAAVGAALYAAWSHGLLTLVLFYLAATLCSMCNGVLTAYSTSLALSLADRSTGAAGAIVGCLHLSGAVFGAHVAALGTGSEGFRASAFVGVLGAANLLACLALAAWHVPGRASRAAV